MSTESCSTVRVRGEEVNSRINEVAGGYGRSARLENTTLSFVCVQFHGFRTTQTFYKKPPQRHDVIFCSGWPQQ